VSTVNKYALKCCLLHCIVTGAIGAKPDETITNDSLLECIRTILRRLWQVVLDDAVPSVANPVQLLPVWNYEPGPYYCRWYIRQAGLSYRYVIGQSTSFCSGCRVEQTPIADAVSSIIAYCASRSALPDRVRWLAENMCNTFIAFHEFCHELAALPTAVAGDDACLSSGCGAEGEDAAWNALVNSALDVAYVSYTCKCNRYRDQRRCKFDRFLTIYSSTRASAAVQSVKTDLWTFLSNAELIRFKQLLDSDDC